jgi:hypothetical protein
MTDILHKSRRVPFQVVLDNGDRDPTRHMALFRYCTALPWGVVLVFSDPNTTVEFSMDRAVLADGCETDAGDGDVYVRAVADGVEITLNATAGPADEETFLFDRDELLEFLDTTWKLVEVGTEGEFFEVPDDVIGAIQLAGDY